MDIQPYRSPTSADLGQLAEVEPGRTVPPSFLDNMRALLQQDPNADLDNSTGRLHKEDDTLLSFEGRRPGT